MRKIRFVEIVIPEIVAYIGSDINNMTSDYRCPKCGYGISEDYVCCPYCSSELNWQRVKKPSKEFQKFLDKL